MRNNVKCCGGSGKTTTPPLSTPRAGMFPILRSPLELYFQWIFNVVPNVGPNNQLKTII